LAVASVCGSAAPCAAGACVLGLLFLAVRLATRGRGLGLGDVKLAACIGAGLGIAGGLWSVGIASVGGGLYGVALLALGRAQPKTAIPFGPFLAAGCLAAGGYACFR
jgi:prepilin signal peptidase PulO-like enzyme (type II secretory pathway)